MFGVIETPTYLRSIAAFWGDDEAAEFVNFIAASPLAGDVIPGTSKLRKVRWAAKGHGKRGGVRVIYYWYVANELITFCRIYPKNEKENLTSDEIKTINDELEN